MFKVTIVPQWQIESADGRQLPARLVPLLVAVRDTGSLAAACRQVDLSYRYGWGMLRDARDLFGIPLLRAERGRGARLTALGERLVWADSRIAARLSPTLDSLATELEAELERTTCQNTAPLRLHASHGFGVEALRRAMAAADQPLDLKYRSPDDALAALRAGACDLAGLHLPLGELHAELLGHYRDQLDVDGDRVVNLALRRQGLIVAPGNPKQIRDLADLTRDDVRFIHRQPGSGTRLLLEAMLARQRIPLASIHGCDVEELTHAAVAAYVASGLADAGFGLEPPARRYGLDFLPMVTERYFFLGTAEALASPQVVAMVALLRDGAFRAQLGALPGYDATDCGSVQTLPEALGLERVGR